jgi:hypothetical protein
VTKATLMASTVIRQARLVSVGSPAPTGEPVDIRIKDGVVVAVATGLRPEGGEQVIDAAGRWAIPGLFLDDDPLKTATDSGAAAAHLRGCEWLRPWWLAARLTWRSDTWRQGDAVRQSN